MRCLTCCCAVLAAALLPSNGSNAPAAHPSGDHLPTSPSQMKSKSLITECTAAREEAKVIRNDYDNLKMQARQQASTSRR